MDFTNYGALSTLQWTFSDPGAPPPPAALYVQLHVGDPGADGTSNPAVNTERQLLAFAVPANTGSDGRAQILTSASAFWVGVPATETYSHVSLWDAVTGGDAWYKGPMDAPISVLNGSSFVFAAGQSIDHA